jgi:hypothetical protein
MKVVTLAALLAILAGAICDAGTSGVMSGYVRDDKGRPIADATVKVNSAQRYATGKTDKHGFFVFLDLPPDGYNVDVEKDGWIGAYESAVRIYSDQTVFLTLAFNARRHCPTFNIASLGADQRSEQFTSIDVRRMETFPSNVPVPAPILPIAPPNHHGWCL